MIFSAGQVPRKKSLKTTEDGSVKERSQKQTHGVVVAAAAVVVSGLLKAAFS